MTAATWPFPGLVWGPYPQQRLPLRDLRRPSRLGRRALVAEARELHAQLQAPVALAPALDA